MDEIAQMAAVEQIKHLKARYFRGVDTKNWALLRDVFTDDVVCDYRGAATDPVSGINAVPSATESVLHGKREVIAALQAALNGVVSVHQGFMPEITIDGPDTASGIWAMYDTLRLPPGLMISELSGYGHYHETYRRHDGIWRIAALQLSRLRVDAVQAQ